MWMMGTRVKETTRT